MKFTRRQIVIGSLGALILAAAALVMMARTGSVQGPEASAPKAVMAVSTVSPESREWLRALPASGTIVAWQEAVIAAETAGLRIAALHAETGQQVRRGELLAELARASTEAGVRRYEASLASATASLAKARANAARARLLKGAGTLSEEQINDTLIAEQTAQADVALAEAQLQVQRITLSQTRIVAADDGIITSRSAVLGQVVSAGTELFRLQRQGKLEWQAEVDARQLARVRPGAAATLTLPDGRALQGKVRLLAPTLSTNTSRANVLVSLPAGAVAGMFASGSIDAERREVLTLPQTAVTMRDGIAYAFELGADNKVVRHRVSTGQVRDGRVEIASGVSSGMTIVASGGAFLADGDRVSLPSAGSAK